jgi:hypothetical protein
MVRCLTFMLHYRGQMKAWLSKRGLFMYVVVFKLQVQGLSNPAI